MKWYGIDYNKMHDHNDKSKVRVTKPIYIGGLVSNDNTLDNVTAKVKVKYKSNGR